MKRIFASSAAVLDSNVQSGGGTDVTEEIQAILDSAADGGGVHLIMDGAALVHGLTVHSNTIIECLNKDCGFFMADHTNRPLIRNADWSLKEIKNRSITLLGGTYNHNCTKQAHHVSVDEFPLPEGDLSDDFVYYCSEEAIHAIYLAEFYGVENLIVRDVTLKNQRSYAFTLGNFLNTLIENCSIDMAELVHPSNQDGFHFFGPGKFLTIKNVRGCTGDDFINVAPDEMDNVSSITDVLIDGVTLDDCCQGIRMLSHKEGRLDRVTVRNVSGRYRTFGFSIMPFYRGKDFGNYGDFFFENINLQQIPETYHYTPMTFFQLGGDFDCVTMKNIRFHSPCRGNTVLDIGNPYFYAPEELTQEEIEEYSITYPQDWFDRDWIPDDTQPRIKTLIIDGLTISTDETTDKTSYIELRYDIDNCILKNIQLFRSGNAVTGGNLIKLCSRVNIRNMILEDIFAEKVDSILSAGEGHKVDLIKADNILLKNGTEIFKINDAEVEKLIKSDMNQI